MKMMFHIRYIGRKEVNDLKNKASYGHDEISNKLLKRAGPAFDQVINTNGKSNVIHWYLP